MPQRQSPQPVVRPHPNRYMKIITAIFLYVVIVFSLLQNWLFVAGIGVLIYSLRYSPVVLIPLAILIDGYFGNFYGMPYLSLFSVWWYMVSEYFRPKIVNLKFIGD
jgi:apolipoprotein N-acyltransferase